MYIYIGRGAFDPSSSPSSALRGAGDVSGPDGSRFFTEQWASPQSERWRAAGGKSALMDRCFDESPPRPPPSSLSGPGLHTQLSSPAKVLRERERELC